MLCSLMTIIPLPFSVLSLVRKAIATPPANPCRPTPCGLYSGCRNAGGRPVCTCQRGYKGSPPNCKPQCMVSSECPQDRACVKQKCVDPCAGLCGVEALCQVTNHVPLCACRASYTGDPFVRCEIQRKAVSVLFPRAKKI